VAALEGQHRELGAKAEGLAVRVTLLEKLLTGAA
jgi:hypothetical protein